MNNDHILAFSSACSLRSTVCLPPWISLTPWVFLKLHLLPHAALTLDGFSLWQQTVTLQNPCPVAVGLGWCSVVKLVRWRGLSLNTVYYVIVTIRTVTRIVSFNMMNWPDFIQRGKYFWELLQQIIHVIINNFILILLLWLKYYALPFKVLERPILKHFVTH